MTMNVSKKLTTQYAGVAAVAGLWQAGAPLGVLIVTGAVSGLYIIGQSWVDAVKAGKG